MVIATNFRVFPHYRKNIFSILSECKLYFCKKESPFLSNHNYETSASI